MTYRDPTVPPQTTVLPVTIIESVHGWHVHWNAMVSERKRSAARALAYVRAASAAAARQGCPNRLAIHWHPTSEAGHAVTRLLMQKGSLLAELSKNLSVPLTECVEGSTLIVEAANKRPERTKR